jgi:hypothetical protein
MLCLFFTGVLYAQEKDSLTWNTEIGIYNRYIWRGVNFGDAPSLQGLCSASYKNFELGVYGANSLSGTALGYANTIEVFATYSYKQFSLTVDDYFFYEAVDSLNHYFDYGSNTLHFLEGRIKYSGKIFDGIVGYNFYSRASNQTTGVYLELGCRLSQQFKVVVGGITDASFLNFNDKAGITNIGLYFKKPIKISSFFSFNTQFGVVANPNYKSIARIPGVSLNPLHFLLSVSI